MEGKKIDIYHKSIKQTIKVYDNTSEEDLINFVKKIFHLNVKNSQIFFQDEEGNFLLIPKIIPNGLKVYLYIEPEYNQDISQIKPNNSLLQGFKWDNTISNYDGKAIVSNDGYVLGEKDQNTGWTPVVSTTIYKTGKLFCKLNIKGNVYQSLGVCNLQYDGKKLHWNNENVVAFDSYKVYFNGNYNDDDFAKPYAFLLNMDKKKFMFYELKNNKYNMMISLSFKFNEVKIYGWVKCYGFSILEGGSSQIPDYLNY